MTRPDLEALLALQDIDTRLDQEQHRKAHLPERLEIAELDRSAALATDKRRELAGALDEITTRQAAAESELRATEQRLKTVNDRLFGGAVSASRDLQAMSHDVDGLRKRASDLEDKVLGLLDEREPLDKALATIDAELFDIEERKADVATRLTKSEKEVEEVVASLTAQRQAAVSSVPEQLVPSYERLRAKLGGVAVARLVGGRCDGCHLALPAMELDRVLHHPTGSLEYCEQCGRVLVPPSSAV
ncbi:MAG TPA: C4-type zinc ribbon domain-containing protein [Acidimicrobiales bacterium]|nr:C4-type zinc ribbon domain-containing protein [Acidimicrobiales bacterium]